MRIEPTRIHVSKLLPGFREVVPWLTAAQERVWRLRMKREWIREQLRAPHGYSADGNHASCDEPWDEAFGAAYLPIFTHCILDCCAHKLQLINTLMHEAAYLSEATKSMSAMVDPSGSAVDDGCWCCRHGDSHGHRPQPADCRGKRGPVKNEQRGQRRS